VTSTAYNEIIRNIRGEHACLGVASPEGFTLTVGGHHDTLLWSRAVGAGSGQLHSWSPDGVGTPADGLPGFTGEREDPFRGYYLLGNGYRAYSPALGRFTCPDSLSPFGAGGFNPYAYCAGDPVNHTDPSGHFSWQSILGIVAGTLGLVFSLFTAGTSIAAAGGVMAAIGEVSGASLATVGLGIMADATGIVSGALEEISPKTSSVLGWMSAATGLMAGTVPTITKMWSRSALTDETLVTSGGEYFRTGNNSAHENLNDSTSSESLLKSVVQPDKDKNTELVLHHHPMSESNISAHSFINYDEVDFPYHPIIHLPNTLSAMRRYVASSLADVLTASLTQSIRRGYYEWMYQYYCTDYNATRSSLRIGVRWLLNFFGRR